MSVGEDYRAAQARLLEQRGIELQKEIQRGVATAAGSVSFDNSSTPYTATTVQAAIAEIDAKYLGNATPASGAATIANGPSGVSGDPDAWIRLNVGGTEYVVPGWTP